MRSLAALVVVLALGVGIAGCGGSSKPTLTIGARNTPEETILAQIYAQALRHAGYTVGKVVNLGSEPINAPNALKRGRISGFPDHLSTPTNLAWAAGDEVPADPEKAYRETLSRLVKEGMTAFPPAPFSFTNFLIAPRAIAAERGLKTISDLKKHPEELVVAGVLGCHEAINCMEGLERRYGLSSLSLISGLEGTDEVFEALNTRIADLAFVPSTDGRLSADRDKISTLEDDKHLFPAGNAIFVTTPQAIKEAGAEFEGTVVAVQKGLTLSVMQNLDAEVEIEKRDPATVAADYLTRTELGG